ELFEKLNRVQEAESKLQVLERRLEQTTVVRSPYTGRIIEYKADLGDSVHVGTPILAIELDDRPLVVALFTNALEGKKIQPGMTIEITPSTVKREEDGYLVGTVQDVSDFPTSEESMLVWLPNKILVQKLAREGASFEVQGQLQVDPEAPSGYR